MADVKEIAKNNKITNYVRESFRELTKVTWPTKNQAVRLTIIVLSVCLVFAIALTVMDFVFGQGHNYLVKWSANFVSSSESSSTSSDFPIQIDPNSIDLQTTPVDTSTETPAD